MCQASPVAQWWECPTSAWESVGYFWHGGYFLIFVNFFFTIWNEQCHFQSVQALYCFYFNVILYVNCYVILLHPQVKHCLITYCAFQKLESASQTSNFESEIVFAEKNHQFLACYMYVGIDWFGWTVLSESEIPNRRGLVGQFWKMEAVKESQEHSQDMNCNISLTCNYCFHGGELYFPIWYAFFLCFRLQTVTWSCRHGVKWQSGRNMLVASGSSVRILTFSMLLWLTLIWTMSSKSSLFSNRCCGSVFIFFCFGVC